jgi:hypothetical protein
VEWWDNNLYGVNEVQTILVSGDVDGGTWLLKSPGGYLYPFPLPWDIEYDELEAVLESIDDVGDVEVSLEAYKKTREYRITFLSNIGDVASLNVDYSGLTASNGTRGMVG